MGVLKIISSGYFHKDHLQGIINPKFQLSSISGWRDIADFKMQKKQTKIFQTRICICYIFLDFYAKELKLSEIKEWTVTFVMNRKKALLGVKVLSCYLKCVFFGSKFYRDLGSISQKTHAFFFFKSHTSLETFTFLLTNLKKYSGKYQIILKKLI